MEGPPPPGSLVALRERREALIQVLTDSFATDVIDLEEFEARLGRAHAAGTVAELDALGADLAARPGGASSTALAPLSVDTSLARAAAPARVRALFGNVERRGPWVVPATLEARATFGNVELDFREARFSAAVTELDARAVFGNLELIVPPQLAVQCEGSSVFGNVESHGSNALPDPDRPLLRVIGRAVFGNIEIHTRLPGAAAAGQRAAGRGPRQPQLDGSAPPAPRALTDGKRRE